MALSAYRVRPSDGDYHPAAESYDLVLSALGYEERSSYVSGVLSPENVNRLALMFDQTGVSDQPQYAEMLALGARIQTASDHDVVSVLTQELAALDTPGRASRVAVDVSSFSRPRIFNILRVLSEQSTPRSIDVDILYAPALVSEDLADRRVVIESVGFLAPELSGWGSDPTLPLAAIVGVGAERDLALGVAEYLEVARIHAFVPTGVDSAFDEVALRANADFFLEDYAVTQTAYDLRQPATLLAWLDALLHGLSRDYRVAVVPLGPKLFSVCAMLSALYADAPVAVWRFSQRESNRPSVAQGTVICLPLTFEPHVDSGAPSA